jgi:hypothetical protein
MVKTDLRSWLDLSVGQKVRVVIGEMFAPSFYGLENDEFLRFMLNAMIGLFPAFPAPGAECQRYCTTTDRKLAPNRDGPLVASRTPLENVAAPQTFNTLQTGWTSCHVVTGSRVGFCCGFCCGLPNLNRA